MWIAVKWLSLRGAILLLLTLAFSSSTPTKDIGKTGSRTKASEVTATLPEVLLSKWKRGVGIIRRATPETRMYFWFYEWNLFGAWREGQHNQGTTEQEIHLSADGSGASLTRQGLSVELKATDDGADLFLRIRNGTERTWANIAAIIPCFTPGAPDVNFVNKRRVAHHFPNAKRNENFVNHQTYFLSERGLMRQEKREIHFNVSLREQINQESEDGSFVFTPKWPTSEHNATSGLVLRESTDKGWITGIAWERFLTVQAHNPWHCMHLSIRVGPLKPGESREIRGKIYLFHGTKEDLLKRYRSEFRVRGLARNNKELE